MDIDPSLAHYVSTEGLEDEVDQHPILVIIQASLATSIEFIIGVGLGILIAHPKYGILKLPSQSRILSKMLIYFFLPTYIVKSFATSTDFMMIVKLYWIPLMSTIMQIMQILLAELFFPFWRYSKKEEEYRRMCSLSVMFNNYTFIPIVFVASLIEMADLFEIDNAADLAIVYVSLYAIPQRIFFYGFGLTYIGTLSEEESDKKKGFFGTIITLFKKILSSPPIIAIIIGLLIACIPPVQQTFFTDPPLILRGIPASFTKIGNVVKGLSVIVIGATVGRLLFKDIKSNAPIPNSLPNKKNAKKTTKEKISSIKRIVSKKVKETFSKDTAKGIIQFCRLKHVSYYDMTKIVFLKLIAMPVLTMGLLYLTSVFWGKYVLPDDVTRPIIFIVFLVESTTPLIVNLPVISTLYDVGVFLVSEIMIVQYLIAPITMTLFSIFGIYLICTFEKCENF